LTKNFAPELLAVATEAQAFSKGGRAGTSSSKGGFANTAKNFLKPTSLKDLVAKPGAVVSLLKTIMNALKLRWPAFMGTNVLLSLALFGKLPLFMNPYSMLIWNNSSPLRILVLPQTRP
jgi:hypothetical protein